MSYALTAITIMFIGYISVVAFIGYIASRVTRNLSDYFLGGRRLPAPIAALGAGASDMSSWLLLAVPGAAYALGLSQIWLPLGLSIGAYLNWKIVASRLRVYTEVANNSLTIPAYIGNRFHDETSVLRIATSIVIVIFFTFYASAGFVSGALLTQQTFGFSYQLSLIISASIIVAYTCIGGFLAVSWIDFFQGSLMFLALLIVPIVTTHATGGWDQVMQTIKLHHPQALNILHNLPAINVISLLAWGLGYFGQPHILVRFMAINSHHGIPVARRICMTWMMMALGGAILTGFTGLAYFTPHPLKDPEAVFLVLARELFNPWLTGFLLAAVLSAVMSAIAAQLLASASALSEDFYHALFRKHATRRELLWFSRFSLLMIASVAIVMAGHRSNTIFNLVGYAWSGLGASFGPVILISLLWKRMTRNAALAGLLTGASTVILWSLLGKYFGGIFNLYEMVPAFFLNVAVIILVSLFGKPAPKSVRDEFDEVKELHRR